MQAARLSLEGLFQGLSEHIPGAQQLSPNPGACPYGEQLPLLPPKSNLDLIFVVLNYIPVTPRKGKELKNSIRHDILNQLPTSTNKV